MFLFLIPAVSTNVFAEELSLVTPLAPYAVFRTWSAFSLPEGSTSISYGIERSKDPSFYRHTLGISYGWSDRAEVTLDLPYVDNLQGGSGFEDFGGAFKYRVQGEGRYTPAASVLVMGYLPTGRDILSRDGGVGGGAALSRKLGPILAHANFIYTISGKNDLKDEMDFLTGLEFAASHNLKMLGEFQLRKSAFSNKVDLSEVRFGYRYSSGDVYNTIGAGFDLKNRHPEFRLMIAFGASFERESRR
ncbi:MAG: transporter [Nitrospiraceae bacterium]|nr:transporter [Nitrospiraceae bacterium]